MNKLSKFSLKVFMLFFGVMIFVQKAYADVVYPGQTSHGPGTGWGAGQTHNPPTESQLPVYIFIGITIIVVIIISVIILNKIRKRK